MLMGGDSNKAKSYVRFKARNAESMHRLVHETHLTADEVFSASLIYFELLYNGDPKAEYITRPQFVHVFNNVFDMRDPYLVNRVMQVLDRGLTANVTIETWVRALSLFMRGTLDERMRFCFTVYNVHQAEALSRESLVFLLRNTLGKHRLSDELEEACIDMSDFLMKRMDQDLDGSINYADYEQVVRERPSLMEVFGQCFPERTALRAFVSTFSVVGGAGGEQGAGDAVTRKGRRSGELPTMDAACAERVRLALKMTPSDVSERVLQRERQRRERARTERRERLREALTKRYVGCGLEEVRKVKTN